MKATEQISVALFPEAPPGSTPNALALSPDGQRLLVANADNNTVAIVDVSNAGASRVIGFIPTGWYPTGVAVQPRRRGDLRPERQGPHVAAESARTAAGHAAAPRASTSDAMLQGSLSILPMPDDATLRAYTNTVYRVTPYSDATRLAPAAAPADIADSARASATRRPSSTCSTSFARTAPTTRSSATSSRGNGDPTLALFGEDVTPNAHALAREFVTLDNFYVDAEVSYDGHAFSTGAYRDGLRARRSGRPTTPAAARPT